MTFWRYILTGSDNQTFDVVRVTIAIMCILFCALIVWGMVMVTLDKTFPLSEAFNGFAVMFGSYSAFILSGGGALALKHKTEPKGTENVVEP